MVRVPVTEPLAGGVKVIVMTQFPPAARLVPQPLGFAVMLKLLDPEVMLMLVIARAVVPPLFSVTDWVGLEAPDHEREVLLTETTVPVPLKLTVCVAPAVPPLLSVMVRVPVTVEPEVGSNVTAIVQLPPADMPVRQVLDGEAKIGDPAVTWMLEKVSEEPPVLVTVTD
jgi:hypothetical protein